MTHNNNYTPLTAALVEQVMGPKKRGYYECPICGNYKLSVNKIYEDRFNCYSCGENAAIKKEILQRAGLWKKKSDRRNTYKQRYDAPPQYLSDELKAELAKSWRPGPDPQFNKENPTTYPKEVVWGLNFSSIKGDKYIRTFLDNPWYEGTMAGWISTMGKGQPTQNQFKPSIPYKRRDRDKANKCTFWLLTYLATGFIPSGWQQFIFKKPAKYLTSRKGYGTLIPKIPYQLDYWEKVKSDRSIPLEGLEGAKKTAANLFCLGTPSIGFFGVEMWHVKGSKEILPEAAELIRDRQDYTIKFDADCQRKPEVLRAIIDHGLAAQKLGATVSVAIWDESYGKGIDDVIAAGHDASYTGGLVQKIPFAQFLKENPLPQQQEMLEDFKGFAYKLFQNFKNSLQLEANKAIAKADRQKVEIPNLGKVIEYKGSDRLKVWEKLESNQFNADLSFTGSGKSHACGNLDTRNFEEVEKVIYLHSQHANPPTTTLGKWDNLPPRHNGLVAGRGDRKNPDGLPQVSWPLKGEKPNIPGNCKYAHLFAQGTESNVPYEELNAICKNCEFGYKTDKEGKFQSHICANDEGEGYGYKWQRMRALMSPNLRAHPASLPPDLDYSQTLLFWDEFSTQFINSRSFAVGKSQIIEDFAELELKSPGLFQKLTPVRLSLLELFKIEKLPRYGFGDRDLRLRFRKKIEKQNPSLFTPGSEWRERIVAETAKIFTVNLDQEIKASGLDDLKFSLRWMSDFLRVLGDESCGAMSFDRDILTLTIRDTKALDIIKSAKFNIFADATLEPELVAKTLGIEREKLVAVREETPRHDHLQIVQVDFERHITKGDRSQELNKRIDAAHKSLQEKHGDGLITFNYKANASKGDLIQFADNRGINHAEKKKALCTVGDPYIHRGAIAIRFQLSFGRSPSLDGSDEEFESYYTKCCQAEVIQMLGRLRAARRQGEELFYYHFGNLDLSFLREILPGCKYQKILARDLTPDAAPRDIRFKVALIEAAIDSVKNGVAVTQEVLARKLSVTQGTISKFVKNIAGGWWFVKALFQTLLDNFSRGWNNLDKMREGLSEEELDWLEGYFEPSIDVFSSETIPDEKTLVLGINTLLEHLKPGRVFALVRALSLERQFKLLRYLVQIVGLDIIDLSPHLRF